MKPLKPTMSRENQAVNDWLGIASSARVTLSANTENVPTLLKGFDL